MGLRATSGIAEESKKQAEMGRAFSPTNNFKQNKSDENAVTLQPDKTGVMSGEEGKKAGEKQAGQENRAATQRTAQAAIGLPEVSKLIGNLGIFNMSLMAAVNQFTNGEPISTANATLTKGGQPVFNAATGMWEAPTDTAVEAADDSLLAEKKNQQAALQEAASQIFDEKGNAKSFDEVLKKFADTNRDGVIDPQEQQWLNEAFDIANTLTRLNNSDPFSAEVEALKSQLAAKDRNGLVSGILGAMDEYNAITGAKAVGADADTYYLRDLLTMDEDTLKAEIDKALTQSSGLFGADYEAYLQREVDKSARQYTESAREDATVMQKLKTEATAWLNEWKTQFAENKDKLNSMFKGASKQLIKELDEQSASGNKGIEQAKQWFVDTQTLVDSGNKDFGDVIFQALTDSKLGAEPKAILRKWLGSTIGEETTDKGVLANLLDKISTSGYFWTEDENGNQIQVTFNPKQKMDVVRIVNDKAMTDAQKADAVQALISSASKGMGTRLGVDMNKVTEPITSGNLEKGLNTFTNAMTQSMSGFDESLVQAGYGAAVESMGRGIDPAAMQQAVEVKAAQKLDEINKALEDTKKAVETLKATVATDVSNIDANIKDVTVLNQKGVESVRQNYSNALSNYMKQFTDPSYGSNIAGQPASYLQAMWTRSMGTAAMPTTLNEKYGKAFAAGKMAQNMRATSDKTLRTAYTVLVRDYLGGDDSAVERLELGRIFNDPKTLETVNKIAQALSSADFASDVWQTTNSAKAVNSKLVSNQQAKQTAEEKLKEAQRAASKMEVVYYTALEKLGQAKELALNTVKQEAPQLEKDWQIQNMTNEEWRNPDGSLAVMDERGNRNITGWSGNAINQHVAQYGFDPRATNPGIYYIDTRTGKATQQGIQELGLDPNTTYSPEMAQRLNAGSAAGTANFQPLKADISGQTANNMFNQAIGGQVMDFTKAPNVDLDALRALGNVQYTSSAAGGQVQGLEQYVTPDWTPAGSLVATATKGTNPPPINEAAPMAAPAATPATTVPVARPKANTERETPTGTDLSTQIVKREPTDDKNTIQVTTADGKTHIVNAPGGVYTDNVGKQPSYDPSTGDIWGNGGTGGILSSKPSPVQAPTQAKPQSVGSIILGAMTPDWVESVFGKTPQEKAQEANIGARAAERDQQTYADAQEGYYAGSAGDMVPTPQQQENPDFMHGYVLGKAEAEAEAGAETGDEAEAETGDENPGRDRENGGDVSNQREGTRQNVGGRDVDKREM